MASGISKRFCRYISQEVCPWNERFAQELREPAFQPRDAIASRDARTLAREFLAMTQDEFSAAYKGSPMKRATLRGLKRNAAVVLGNIGEAEDVPTLLSSLHESEPLVRPHAAWALRRIGTPEALEALRATAPKVSPADL